MTRVMISSTTILRNFLGCFALAAVPLLAQNYTFALVECGDLTAFPSSMNAAGVIVGGAHSFSSQVNSGFIYSQGHCTATNAGGRGTDFLGVTNDSQILALFERDSIFALAKGSAKFLPSYPNAYLTYYSAKTPSGLYAGIYYLHPLSAYGIGFFYKNGAFVSLPGDDNQQDTFYAINDAGVAVGTSYGYTSLGFVLQDSKITYSRYPNATYTYFGGINNNNVIVGHYYIQKTGQIGVFTYDLNADTWTDLNFPAEYNAVTPVGISDSGVIAALYSPSGGLLIATPVAK